MKDILISLFQQVYLCCNENALLVYDPVKNRTYEQNLTGLDYIIKGNVIIFYKASDSVLSFAASLARNGLGYVSLYRKGDKSFIHNYYDKLTGTYKEMLELSYLPVKDAIYEISVYLDSSYESFTFKESQSLYKEIDYELLKVFFRDTKFNNIGRIRFIAGKRIPTALLKDVLKSFRKGVVLELITSSEAYLQGLAEGSLIKDKNVEYTILCDHSFREKVLKQPGLFTRLKDVYFLVPFKSKADLQEIDRIKFPDDRKVIMEPVYENNYLFLFKELRYNKKDVLNVKYTIKDIARKEVINELYWGKITIDNEGYIYSAPDSVIGDLKNFRDYHLLLSKDSLWIKVRNDFSACRNCNYRNLCPPLSLVEIQSNEVFCTFGKPK